MRLNWFGAIKSSSSRYWATLTNLCCKFYWKPLRWFRRSLRPKVRSKERSAEVRVTKRSDFPRMLPLKQTDQVVQRLNATENERAIPNMSTTRLPSALNLLNCLKSLRTTQNDLRLRGTWKRANGLPERKRMWLELIILQLCVQRLCRDS